MSSTAGLPNPSRVPQILAGILLPTLFASIFVVARLYTRFIITRNWGNDDTLITIAWVRRPPSSLNPLTTICPIKVTSLGLAVTNALLIPFGGGHHAIFQKPSQITPTLKIAFIGRLIYQFVLCLTKLGICLFYLRVFQDKASKRQVYMIAAFTIISALVIEIEFVFQCNPVSDAWNFVNPNCKATNPSVVTNCVCNIIADVWIMAFVIPRVLPLQMARRQKFSLLGVVSLGMLVIAASIVRCILVVKLATNDDPTWNGHNMDNARSSNRIILRFGSMHQTPTPPNRARIHVFALANLFRTIESSYEDWTFV